MRHLPDQLAELARELPMTLSKEQALEVLHMSQSTFTRVVQRGDLKIIKQHPGRGGRVIVTRAEILRFMSERTVVT